MRNSDDVRSGGPSAHAAREPARYEADDRYYAPNYDSHYDEGEDHVGFVNIIDMDIPFFQLVWLIFKIFLAAIVAASIIALLAALIGWVMSLPVVQNILPGDASWISDLINNRGS